MGTDEAALIASKEECCLGLLDGLTEPAGGKVDFAAESLCLVVPEEILEHGGAVEC